MGDPIIMWFIQHKHPTNPDEIHEALDNPFVHKDGAENSEPRASGCKEKCWAACVIVHN